MRGFYQCWKKIVTSNKMKTLLFVLSIMVLVIPNMTQSGEQPIPKPIIAYITATGLLHGIGKALYSYSGASKYYYNIDAIHNSNLNIFTFPKEQLKNRCEQMGLRVLTLSSALHA